MQQGNLYAGIPEDLPEELIEILALSDGARVERIVSRGHRSPDQFMYDQARDELVVLLSGSAEIRFKDETEPRVLHKGDYFVIPAHCQHRVEWTDPERDTIWLAVHFQ